MKEATGDSVVRACSKTFKRIEKEGLTAASTSAGFFFPEGKQKKGFREGYQVFVKIIKYSDVRLANHPQSGGLHCEL